MPENQGDKLLVNVNIEITAAALQAIVANAKRMAPRNSNGTYRVDTADQVSAIISRFLDTRGFEQFARDSTNYEPSAS
ncbi:hypothetical protein [Desulfatitalea alkaliphila]|uniref:Uncharacterized protein n=1 Tax=Desulfatitalea alkaliphila TaxID=2929485 RepID=A0AA41UKP3_9BACT|nr:hypothetical protein [Desulfatitalea alkaliphila]MCJ8502514.1 hypothetical protein [Desulfatitalea alkaliphila]